MVSRNTDELPQALMKPKHWQLSAASNAAHDGLNDKFTFAGGLTNHCRVWREQQEDHSLQVSNVGRFGVMTLDLLTIRRSLPSSAFIA